MTFPKQIFGLNLIFSFFMTLKIQQSKSEIIYFLGGYKSKKSFTIVVLLVGFGNLKSPLKFKKSNYKNSSSSLS